MPSKRVKQSTCYTVLVLREKNKARKSRWGGKWHINGRRWQWESGCQVKSWRTRGCQPRDKRGRAFQAKETASAKALWWACARLIGGTSERQSRGLGGEVGGGRDVRGPGCAESTECGKESEFPSQHRGHVAQSPPPPQQEVEFWIICLCYLCVCLLIQWISTAFRVRKKKKKAKQLSSLKSFAEFQIFLNISKIFESILLSFLFSHYILEQFLRTSQNSLCIMKDFPQRKNPPEVFNGMNWVKINCIKNTK